MHESFGTRIFSFVHQMKEKRDREGNKQFKCGESVHRYNPFLLFFDSWSFGVVLWEMATLGKWIILRFILIMLNLKLIDKWTKIFHSL